MMVNISDLDPNTPVIVGVGQKAERIDQADYQGLSPIDLAVQAARSAVSDTGVDEAKVIAAIETIAATRQFENSTPGAPAPLGKSTNFPRSVANRLGANVRRAVLEVGGGQSPQHLLTEFSRVVDGGDSGVVLLTGAEAISTIRHLATAENKPDFSDDPEGASEDRGFGLNGLASLEQFAHGLDGAPPQYALLENARRAARGESREKYSASMGTLFAPFTTVAAANPYSAAPHERTAEELVTIDERNRMIADPYPRFMVARDQVNQAAAVLLCSVATATQLGVSEDKWVFLHGQADVRERNLLEREHLGESPAAVSAVEHALSVAGIGLGDVDYFDLYSCFPIAVSNVSDALGLSPDDPRGLTVTGGLPFFGGAGNNYSMHAIVEVVNRVRSRPASYGLVGANGGVLSKYSVGIYSTIPTRLHDDDSARLQRQIDALPAPVHNRRPSGWATIETYTVKHGRKGKQGVVIGRLDTDDSRFLAMTDPGDTELLELLEKSEQPVGRRIFVRAFGFGNRVTTDEATMAELHPDPEPTLRDSYKFVSVRRDGHLLEVTINRPDARNSLHPPAHEELSEIFDAYYADPDLWVAIITGCGDKSFCAGNDLMYSASGKPMYIPVSGFGGLTSRRDMVKPVIAAVNGFAMGGGFEIALACHLVVADQTAQFALSEVKVGLVAGAGGAIRLPRSVPAMVANELILTGRRVGADEARELGLVNRVVAAGTALDGARALAREILDGSPTSIRLTLKLMEETRSVADVIEAVTAPTTVIDELMFSQDATEGLTAFAQKRQPQWKNQ
ncbi:MAG: acetyl-CoA acetyltransferase [Gordonia sp.]|nr:acetyl-CoA acetyltransferase [Gordonia sp. (in: high G+C Gram-positive bacteria)]